VSSARFLRLGIVVVAAVLAGSIGFALAGSGIDVVVETWIDAPLDEVYEALIAEAEGTTAWGAPHWRAEVRGGLPPDRVGGLMEITVRPSSQDQTVRMMARTAEVVPGRLIRFEYIEGDFLGEGVLTLEPERKGTRVVFRFAARPTSWKLKVLSPVVKRSHSAAVRAGFAELERHLGRATTVR